MEDSQFEEQFTKGYNNGYLLSHYEPGLMNKLSLSGGDENPYIKGMGEGKRAHERELFLENVEKSRAMTQENKRPKMR